MDNGQPANGLYDIRIHAWDQPVDGNMLNSPGAAFPDFMVTDGLFTAEIDLPPDAVYGEMIWLGILVRPGASNEVYTVVGLRQPLIVTPHALFALKTAEWSSANGRITNSSATEFVGIHRSTRVSSAEYFGVQAPVQSGYGGM